ncbi:F-box/FBD/LRR-repeat protein At5g56420-like [Telopea speciosissima]|uniref:F-box/FBD/LRR-repeat protein At5g56420-like n=1 Tax=Telopea speciosissima TaxID=54955 RepID=UPI001CC4F298|nr:F-box/FBD/LRR-repeat protein At5g56420-like [Telopea speciosissima]
MFTQAVVCWKFQQKMGVGDLVKVGAKNQKSSGKQERVINYDRISELPDPVLHHILSFLPTKIAVSTSMLSRRWRYLWTYVDKLNFEDDLFYSIQMNEDLMFKFMDFVDNVLVVHNLLNIEKLRLLGGDCDAFRIDSWIRAAIKREIKELDIFICPRVPFEFPSCLFNCELLTVLKLNLACSDLKLPTSICLPSLKTMRLDSVIFADENLTHNFFFNCPTLENLIMKKCGLRDVKVLHISAPRLKFLTVDCGGGNQHSLSHCIIKVSTRDLVSLRYCDGVAIGYSLENAHSMVDACIRLCPTRHELRVFWNTDGYSAINLLKGVSHAKVLKLSGRNSNTIEILSPLHDLLDHLPTFYNLRSLKLTAGCCPRHLSVITCLLQSAPNLEYLKVKIDEDKSKGQKCWEPEKLGINCLCDHLKVVELKGFGGRENELELLKFLLENAKSLEKIMLVASVELSDDSWKQGEAKQKLLRFPRASDHCVIELKTLMRELDYSKLPICQYGLYGLHQNFLLMPLRRKPFLYDLDEWRPLPR